LKKLLIALTVALTVALPVGAAMADPPADGPPGQGECEHGNSGQTCVPDPQPTHGQDCEEHGPFEGGVNEDHCLSTVPPTTTIPTTIPPTCEETQTCETTTVPTTPPPITTTVPPVTTEVPPTTTIAPPGASPTEVTPPDKPEKPETKPEKVAGPGKLAFTGVEDVVPIGAAALAFLTSGSYLLWRGRRKDED
jgi:hypothetical protein